MRMIGGFCLDKIYLGDFVEKWNQFAKRKISEAEAIDTIKERMDCFEWQEGVRLKHYLCLSNEKQAPTLNFIADIRFLFLFSLHDGKKTAAYSGCTH